MKRVVVRERIDWKEDGFLHSLIHRVWDDGTVEYVGLDQRERPPQYKDEHKPVLTTAWRGVSSTEWEMLVKIMPAQAVYENSEWGDGLSPVERDAYFASLRA